jgi:hypothetical protein
MLPLINQLNLCSQIARLMQLLDEWIADESGYEESTWDELAEDIDQNRDAMQARRLFS